MLPDQGFQRFVSDSWRILVNVQRCAIEGCMGDELIKLRFVFKVLLLLPSVRC